MKNKKGFTLVELLVAVAILGIITGMSIPLIRNIRMNNDQRKYNSYGDSLISAAKLYVDSYGQDLFGYKKTGCAIITYEQLKDKGLIKDFVDNNISCDSENTLVRIVKINKQYGYSYQLYCGSKDATGKASSAEFKSSSTSKRVSEVIKKQKEGSTDKEGFDESLCNYTTSMNIKITPEKALKKEESHAPKIFLASTTGINERSSIQYAWIDADDKEGHTTVDFNKITDWNTATFSVESKEKQMQKILAGASNSIESKKKTLKTPNTSPAYYLLVLKVDNFRDLEGEYWKNKDNNPYVVAGVYNIGKKYTLTYNNNGGSGCTSLSILKEKNVDTKWGDLCTPTKTNSAFNGWNTKADGTGTTITKDTKVDSDLTVYAVWRQSKIHFRLKIEDGENLASTTTSSKGDIYKWNKNNESYLMLSKNNSEEQMVEYQINKGKNIPLDLPNYNNKNYINISRLGYYAPSGAEWICESGCKKTNQTFSHDRITIDDTDKLCDTTKGDCVITLKVNWKESNYTFKLSSSGIIGTAYIQKENKNGDTVRDIYISGATVQKSSDTTSEITNITVQCTATKGLGVGDFNATSNISSSGTDIVHVKPIFNSKDKYVINVSCSATGKYGDRNVSTSTAETFTLGNGWYESEHSTENNYRTCYDESGVIAMSDWKYYSNGELAVGWKKIYWYNGNNPQGQEDWYYFFDGTETESKNRCHGSKYYAALGWCKNLPDRIDGKTVTSYQSKWVYFCDFGIKNYMYGKGIKIGDKWCPGNALATNDAKVEISANCNKIKNRTFNKYSFDTDGKCTKGNGCNPFSE